MFLELNHKKLDVYQLSKQLIICIYQLTKKFPPEERFALASQLRRAVVSVHLNIAEGCSRPSEMERKRFLIIARGSLIEVDAALEIATQLNYLDKAIIVKEGNLIIRCFQLLTKMIH